MPKYLLRMEAVNFAWSCYDTNDISTIRGGSMLLANAHDIAQQHSSWPVAVSDKPIVSGASQAIWEFDAVSDDEAEQVRADVVAALCKHEQLRHATFVVDFLRRDLGSVEDVQTLRTRNRWRQLQQPTLAVPDLLPVETKDRYRYCAIDRVRPAAYETHKGDDEYLVSVSTHDRRKYGKDQKQSFYSRVATPNAEFVNELLELTKRPDNPLHEKMAVIAIDGNIQSETAAKFDLAKLKEFREQIRGYHEKFLQSLLADIEREPHEQGKHSAWHYWDGSKHLVRLETLLWGGDDITLIVPAWQGWSVVQKFYEHTKDWCFDSKPFTHATGLVFCRYKAPIQTIRKFAEELQILCKGCKNAAGKYQNRIAFEVLESFDIGGANLAKWRAARLATDSDAKQDELLLAPEQLASVAELVQCVKKKVDDPDAKISRRQIEQRARRMPHEPRNNEVFDAEIGGYFKQNVPAFDDIKDTSIRARLCHLTALWDYIV